MLSASDKERFARQLLLADVGVAGQAKLCAAQLRLNTDADARASEIAREYLTRAGVECGAAAISGDATADLYVHSSAEVAGLAGDAGLREAAAWLAGSFAAVEAIKQIVGVGQPATLALQLAPEKH